MPGPGFYGYQPPQQQQGARQPPSRGGVGWPGAQGAASPSPTRQGITGQDAANAEHERRRDTTEWYEDVGNGLRDAGGWVEDQWNKLTGDSQLNRAAEANRLYPLGSPQTFALPGYDQRRTDLLGFRDSRGGGPFRDAQTGLLGTLQRQASGEDSLSAEQLRQNVGRMQAQQQSMAAGARPQNAALAARLASQNASMLGSQMAGQQALAGIQERAAANQALAALAGQGRQQDLGAYMDAARLELENARGQQQGQLTREQLANQRFGAMTGSPTQAEQALGMIGGGLDWIF